MYNADEDKHYELAGNYTV